MGYRDPREALQAENEVLRQQLREAQDEVEALRARDEGPRMAPDDVERQRWAFGMRCLGGAALMLPFLLMSAVCERRVAYVNAHNAWRATMTPAVATLPPGHPPVARAFHAGCQLSAPAFGFERFTTSIERSARVTQAEHASVSAGQSCTVRVVPVSMREFNCHVEVVCGAQTLYGALPTGYAHCDVSGGVATRAYDADLTSADGDARVNVDLEGQRVTLEDNLNNQASRVELALDDMPPR
ncbi:MAG: hypothetical protein JNK72_24215 [Myxococcales bacterium]|nr:hypothetical protein [Myxococcales bacterium]